MVEVKELTALDKIEKDLKTFYSKFNRNPVIKAKHTEIYIEPKVFVGGELNPDIAKLIVMAYLAKVTIKEILEGRVVITPESIVINDDNGEKLVEITNNKMIHGMINQVTHKLGEELVAKQLVERKEKGYYSFGDIKDALVDFLKQYEKTDSKNLIKEAAKILIVKKTA